MNDTNMTQCNPNMELYNQFREVPVEATKPIEGGDLKGMTNITPQWRIQRLTEVFGPCGFGWKFDTPIYAYTPAEDGSIIVFCSTKLYFKWNGEWSEAIPGEGGNKFAYKTNGGYLKVSDECRKMALTDALSTAAKMIGVGADIYFREGADSKYGRDEDGNPFPDSPFFGTPADLKNEAARKAAAEKAAAEKAAAAAKAPAAQKEAPAKNAAVPAQPAKPAPTAVPAQPAPQPVQAAPANDPRTVVLTFGQYKGKALGEVAALDRQYLNFIVEDKSGNFRKYHKAVFEAANAIVKS